jgi:hypothetical protein
MAVAGFAVLVIVAVAQFAAVLPAFHAYRRKVYGAEPGYSLNWISSADLRAAGMGWAVTMRRVAMLAVALLLAPVVLGPSLCN